MNHHCFWEEVLKSIDLVGSYCLKILGHSDVGRATIGIGECGFKTLGLDQIHARHSFKMNCTIYPTFCQVIQIYRNTKLGEGFGTRDSVAHV